jgi:dihydrofolate synthase/folylpolyglutamate synthase
MTIKEVEHYLNGLQVKTGDLMGKNVTVQRMWPLLEKVGNPQDRLQVVHIAGTSGKTSTAYFIASMLK